jgi:pimeloyl-ACP methyl ester carboxylesterase
MNIPNLPELQFVGIPNRNDMEGNRLCYMEAGAQHKQSVVLLHGIGSNSVGWRFVLEGLSRKYRVVAWNAPGYLLSDNIISKAPTNMQYADILGDFLNAIGIQETFLVGSSFGSMIAATFTARYPKRVKKLALLGTSRGQRWLPEAERKARREGRQESIKNGGIGLAEARWSNLLSQRPSDTAARLTKEVLKATNKVGFLQSVMASDTTDVMDFASDIKAPTLFIVGTEDRVNPPEITRTIQGSIAGSRLVELEGVGHLPKLEVPDNLIQLLCEHFEERK